MLKLLVLITCLAVSAHLGRSQDEENQGLNARAEATRLRRAIRTDGTSVIDVLARRPARQRVEIARAYKSIYGDLVDALDSEFSGNFYRTCRGLCYLPREFDAICLWEAMDGFGTDEEALIDILTARSSQEIEEIKEAYARLYHRTLVSDIDSETSSNLCRVLLSLLTNSREAGPVRPDLVAADADALYEAGEGQSGTNENALNRILCQRSLAHVAAASAAYSRRYRRSLHDAISDETSGDYRDALLSIVSFAEDPARHVADLLHQSMDGSGTNDRRLRRTVVSFSDNKRFMRDVKAVFQRRFGESLSGMIRDDTTGDYQDVLLTLIGDH